MKDLTAIFLLIHLACLSVSAQFYDRYWISGYDYSPSTHDTTFGGTYMDFYEEPVRIFFNPEHKMSFWGTSAITSDYDGNLIFFTNGMEIHDNLNQSIPGGDTIGFGPYWQYNVVNGLIGGMNLRQGCLIFPKENKDGEYLLLHSTADIRDPVLFEMSHIFQTDIQVIDGFPVVINKEELILHDTLMYGKISACRHGNGRDWWVLVGERNTNRYYTLLVSDQGIAINNLQTIGDNVPSGVGQSGFALNGALYYRYEGLFAGDSGSSVHIYDFDRCSGLLSNHRWWYQPAASISGIASSPNGRYLYSTDVFQLWQFDLLAEDIEASRLTVAEWDGYSEPGWFETYFSFMRSAPDARIYIIPPTGGSMVMHVIDRPNERGQACNVLQHHIKLPTWNQRTLPNYPNFRLGPLDGSACDTLGINNIPVARFRHEPETPDLATIRFTDLSYFAPEEWEWDFGDGMIATGPDQIHIYAITGTYNVCLTVRNENGMHNSCQDVYAEKASATEHPVITPLSIYPNPFSEYIEISPSRHEVIDITLTDVNGLEVLHVDMTCPCRISLKHLPGGIYFYRMERTALTQTGKMVKQD